MSATYAGAKGKAADFGQKSASTAARPALRPLSAEEQAKVAMKKAFIEEHLPEVVPLVKDFYNAGLIDGWRSVSAVRLLNKGDGDGTE